MDNITNDINDYSYNYFLYQKRKELNKTEKEFAKELNISRFKYHLIERGYIKPSKNNVIKISDYFNIDFNFYLEGEHSYPKEINDKKYLRITNFIYHLFTKKKTKIILGIITILFLLLSISSFIATSIIDDNTHKFYSQEVNDFKQALNEKGDSDFSLWEYKYPSITKTIDLDENGNQKAIIISGVYDDTDYDFTFKEIYWYDNYRFTIEYQDSSDVFLFFLVTMINYDTYQTNYGILTEFNSHSILLGVDGNNVEGNEAFDLFKEAYGDNVFSEDINNLIKEKLDVDFDFANVIESITISNDKVFKINIITIFLGLGCIALLAISIFVLGYAIIYQKQKDKPHEFGHSDMLLGFKPKNKEMKKDIKIFTFIPEVILRLVGITLVIIGTTRLMVYAQSITNYSSANFGVAGTYYSIQMLGMFFIFFINFDVFMDDERLFRNLLLYIIVYFLIYLLEASLVDFMAHSESIFSIIVGKLKFPNPFGSATCYFLIMLFLFFTPKKIKTKKGLIIYRLLSLIPISFIIAAFIIENANQFFDTDITNTWIKYIFKEDRFPLSLLAIIYLVSLFFLRLYFKKKYGEENAKNYFMGNKFIIIKNIMSASIILIIWILEMCFRNNAVLNKMGIGINTYLILLVPLVLFYHPHKGKRNTKVDITLTALYVLSLIFEYVIIASTMINAILSSIAAAM